ncbi:hypothetical protein CRENBAI_026085 [Crenichthys baileyi]|uniref:B30.2/SPRY domain-containing protein n=1 Tax=Crenichthys baileyi TaxID=28760 RepID=A0AAV9QSJ4_9TELE
MAFKDIEIGEGFIPVCSLGLSQIARINLGQNVSSLRYFTICGLQEGFEPFAINMKRDITMWFSKSLPQFITVPTDHPHIEISRVDGTVDTPPCLKVTHKTVGSQNANKDLLFFRVSIPIEFHETFKVPAGTTLLTRALTIPEDQVLEVDPNSDFEILKKSATRKEQEDDKKESSVPKETLAIKNGENEKDASTEKSKKKGIKRSNCYMVWGGEFGNSQQTRVSQEDFVIGCLVDLDTGLMTFTANGKEINTFYQVEPTTKLFPAVFVQPSNQNVIQFELGKLKNIMPLSAAMFRSERKNPVPQCPPRLDVQMLTPVIWSRMPNNFLAPETGRVNERLGWMVQCMEPLTMMALHIPEENRCVDILELSERMDLLTFHYHTLKLYGSVCALGNNRVAHALCSHVDESQLFYAIESTYLPGPMRSGFYDLLISMHLESAKRNRLGTNKEFIVPMTDQTRSITLYTVKSHALPGVGLTTCLRPKLHFSSVGFVGTDPDIYTLSPTIPLQVLKTKALNMLIEAVQDGSQAMRDPVGGSVEFHFVPILKLISTLLIMGVFDDEDVTHILTMIEPTVFHTAKSEEPAEEPTKVNKEEEPSKVAVVKEMEQEAVAEEEEEFEDYGYDDDEEIEEEDELEETDLDVPQGEAVNDTDFVNGEKGAEETEKEMKPVDTCGEAKEEHLEQGLFQMKLPESVKLQMCTLLQYFCDCELRHRVEAITAFSDKFVTQIQSNQRHRYNELMMAFTMTAAETARKTREFRSPPQEQVNMLMNFKNCPDDEECPVPDGVRESLLAFHNALLAHCGVHIEEEEQEEEVDNSLRGRLRRLLERVKKFRDKNVEVELEPQEDKKPSTLQELISHTMIHWAQESFIQNPELVRMMFSLLHRQYDGLGELMRALPKAYTINEVSIQDTMDLLECLGQIRSLLIVQMGPEEERLIIQSIGNIMSNRVFYQHPT